MLDVPQGRRFQDFHEDFISLTFLTAFPQLPVQLSHRFPFPSSFPALAPYSRFPLLSPVSTSYSYSLPSPPAPPGFYLSFFSQVTRTKASALSSNTHIPFLHCFFPKRAYVGERPS